MEDIRIAPEAPDGGWGWVAVVATFTVGTILSGYLKGIGVLLVEWQLYYDVGAKDVSWIGVAISLLTATSGYLFDTTGNYNLSFYIAGATLFISGIFACFIVHHQNQQTVESDLENDSCNQRQGHTDADRTCTLEMVQNEEWLEPENVKPNNDTADSSDECSLSNRIEGSRVKDDLQYEELI